MFLLQFGLESKGINLFYYNILKFNVGKLKRIFLKSPLFYLIQPQ